MSFDDEYSLDSVGPKSAVRFIFGIVDCVCECRNWFVEHTFVALPFAVFGDPFLVVLIIDFAVVAVSFGYDAVQWTFLRYRRFRCRRRRRQNI